MVKIINDSIFKGIAGKRPTTKPTYFVLHNDAGAMTPESYRGWLRGRYNSGESDKGFAHYYINRDTILRAEDTYNRAWACGNPRYNNNSISYEVCEQLKVSDAEFIENENMVLRQMAEDMAFYEMTPNPTNIKFHREMSSTSCPKRSVELHGGLENLRNYVIKQIAYYQSIGTTVEEMLKYENGGGSVKNGWQKNDTGWWYESSDGTYPKNSWKEINGNWFRFNADGYMLENQWYRDDKDNWYWLKKGGYMAKSETLTIGGKQCYFNDWGALATEIKHYRK